VRVNDLTSSALPEAEVTIRGLKRSTFRETRITDRFGKACFSGLAVGYYQVEVGKPGFLNSALWPVRVLPHVEEQVWFALPFAAIQEGGAAVPALLVGQLTKNGLQLRNTELCLNRANSTDKRICYRTNELGEYIIELAPGEYDILVEQKDSVPVRLRKQFESAGLYVDALFIE
jgi:hypothetical protein